MSNSFNLLLMATKLTTFKVAVRSNLIVTSCTLNLNSLIELKYMAEVDFACTSFL